MTALLDALVDDAGLFPPERLPMRAAVERHRADALVAHPVLTHRFLCPASRVGELRAELHEGELWRLGLVVDVGLDALDDVLAEVDDDPRLVLETVELRLPEDGAVLAAHPTAAWFFELPVTDLRAVPTLADAGNGVKVRCGGLEASVFPTAEELAGFVSAAVTAGARFKATAGLHHAVRYRDPATGSDHHGFLNLLVAVCRAVRGAGADEVAGALRMADGAALAVEVRAVPAEASARARELFVAYGSCSTSEPVEDLVALGLVPAVSRGVA